MFSFKLFAVTRNKILYVDNTLYVVLFVLYYFANGILNIVSKIQLVCSFGFRLYFFKTFLLAANWINFQTSNMFTMKMIGVIIKSCCFKSFLFYLIIHIFNVLKLGILVDNA